MKNKLHAILSFIAVTAFLFTSNALAESPYPIEWAKQFGPTSNIYVSGMALDNANNIFLAGWAGKDFGQENAGLDDAFLVKCNPSGETSWVRQFGTRYDDLAREVVTDSLGNIYVAGTTYGDLNGETNTGDHDAFIVKYNTSGNEVWTRLHGSTAGDFGHVMTRGQNDNIHIGGYTHGDLGGGFPGTTDAFAASFNSDSALQWSNQPVAAYRAKSITTDHSGNTYISGSTLNGPIISKFDSQGNWLWNKHPDLPVDQSIHTSYRLETDPSGNLLIGGYTSEDDYDYFLALLNTEGDSIWTQQYNFEDDKSCTDIAIDQWGNIFVSGGFSNGDANLLDTLSGTYLAKFDPLGNWLWSQHIDDWEETIPYGADPEDEFVLTIKVGVDLAHLEIDSYGSVIASGKASGSYVSSGSPNYSDIVVMKFAVPEPTSVIPFVLCLFALSRNRKT